MERGGGQKLDKKAGGGSNNVSLSMVEDRGQRNLSTEDQTQSSTKACCTRLLQSQSKSKLAGYHSSAANNKSIVLH